MQVIFSRHGNTFSPGDSVVWVGAKQDLSLVSSGIQQAKQLAQAIKKANLNLSAVYCGPLKRVYDYASSVLEELSLSLKPIVDSRLNEIDYGNWSGLTNKQIQQSGQGAELSAWENRSIWPKEAGWSSSAELVISEVKAFAKALVHKHNPEDNVLVISSNGRLRYFLSLIPGLFEECIDNNNFKVATGHTGLFLYKEEWQIKFWNKNPEYLVQAFCN